MRYPPSRLLAGLARFVCRAALRAVITVLILFTCLAGASAYMGAPLPGLRELPDWLESVSQLAGILS